MLYALVTLCDAVTCRHILAASILKATDWLHPPWALLRAPAFFDSCQFIYFFYFFHFLFASLVRFFLFPQSRSYFYIFHACIVVSVSPVLVVMSLWDRNFHIFFADFFLFYFNLYQGFFFWFFFSFFDVVVVVIVAFFKQLNDLFYLVLCKVLESHYSLHFPSQFIRSLSIELSSVSILCSFTDACTLQMTVVCHIPSIFFFWKYIILEFWKKKIHSNLWCWLARVSKELIKPLEGFNFLTKVWSFNCFYSEWSLLKSKIKEIRYIPKYF